MFQCDSSNSSSYDFYQQLQLLTCKAKQHPQESQERYQAIAQLVDAIRRSHRLGRPSKFLPTVVQQISLRLEQQLEHDISQEIDKYNPEHIPIKEWANSLRHRAVKKVLSDDSLINRIALEAKQTAPGSNERKSALNLLVEALQIANKFCHPHNGSLSLSPGLYEYIYNEAIQITLLEICQNIDKYNPSHGIMAWVNFLLPRRFSDACNKYMRQGITQLPKYDNKIPGNNPSQGKIVFLNNPEIIEMFWQKSEADSTSNSLRDLIESDPDSMFSNEHIVGRPDINFKVLALEKVWGNQTWDYLAKKFQYGSIQTLSSFFNRSLKKFRWIFVSYLQD